MLTERPCACADTTTCGGKYTTAEIKMAELDTRWGVQHYHEIMELFIRAFDLDEDEYQKGT